MGEGGWKRRRGEPGRELTSTHLAGIADSGWTVRHATTWQSDSPPPSRHATPAVGYAGRPALLLTNLARHRRCNRGTAMRASLLRRLTAAQMPLRLPSNTPDVTTRRDPTPRLRQLMKRSSRSPPSLTVAMNARRRSSVAVPQAEACLSRSRRLAPTERRPSRPPSGSGRLLWARWSASLASRVGWRASWEQRGPVLTPLCPLPLARARPPSLVLLPQATSAVSGGSPPQVDEPLRLVRRLLEHLYALALRLATLPCPALSERACIHGRSLRSEQADRDSPGTA